MQFQINTETQTKKIAEQLASFLTIGDVVFLIGDLGVGKTTFARYLIQSHGSADQIVPSPTFTLVQSYDLSIQLDHYDLYRLNETDAEDDIIELGWEDSLVQAITVIEWPDRLGTLTPHDRLEIQITLNDDGTRLIKINPYGEWKNRLLTFTEE